MWNAHSTTRSGRRFSALQERRSGGFAIAALMRPPAAGEDEARWLDRAREAEARGPLGLHTHWTAPDHARPTEGTDPAGLVREQGSWLRSVGLEATLFCGGGWYFDERVADAVADLGYADCTRPRSGPRISRTTLRICNSRSRRGSSWPEDAACSSCRRRNRSACSRAASSRGHRHSRSCTRTSTTPTCSIGGVRRRCVWGSVSLGAGGRRRTSASFSVACVQRRRCRSRTSARESARGVRR
jgi:hypothetical protein